jgi:cation diffusion facilitator CzcD-associated flavoprotein CzcO
MYDGLETNVTRAMMTFTDHQWDPLTPLFPRDIEVKRYLQEYAAVIEESQDGLESLTCKVGIDVTNVRCDPSTRNWIVDMQATHDSTALPAEIFQGVVVATGSENVPNMPEPAPGQQEWEVQYPGSIIHSSKFRSAGVFTGKV